MQTWSLLSHTAFSSLRADASCALPLSHQQHQKILTIWKVLRNFSHRHFQAWGQYIVSCHMAHIFLWWCNQNSSVINFSPELCWSTIALKDGWTLSLKAKRSTQWHITTAITCLLGQHIPFQVPLTFSEIVNKAQCHFSTLRKTKIASEKKGIIQSFHSSLSQKENTLLKNLCPQSPSWNPWVQRLRTWVSWNGPHKGAKHPRSHTNPRIRTSLTSSAQNILVSHPLKPVTSENSSGSK